MNKMENIERINIKIADSFERIESSLSEAKDIAGLFEIIFTGIEKEFEASPYHWGLILVK